MAITDPRAGDRFALRCDRTITGTIALVNADGLALLYTDRGARWWARPLILVRPETPTATGYADQAETAFEQIMVARVTLKTMLAQSMNATAPADQMPPAQLEAVMLMLGLTADAIRAFESAFPEAITGRPAEPCAYPSDHHDEHDHRVCQDSDAWQEWWNAVAAEITRKD